MLIYFFLLPALTSASAVVQNLQEEWPICDKDFLNGQYSVPHNLYCDRFFSCVNGSTLLMQCHDGFAYAPFRGCKLLHEVDCGNRTKLQQPHKSETCPRLYGLYEDPQGCGKFISCYNGTATPGQCPDSLAFDANGKYCRTPTDEEKKKCMPAPVQEEPNKNENCPSLYGLYDDPQGCGKFISCYNGTATPGQCPDSLSFDANGKYCRTPTDEEKKKCMAAPALEEPHKSESCPSLYGLYDDPKGCGKYISCYNGTATPGQCPESLAFDANGKYCRAPTDEEKKKCMPAPALLGCMIGPDGINQGSCMWFQCPASAVLPFGDHSRHPYPGHCHYYIMCLRDGNIKIGSCPPGLAFNPVTLICESESTVQSCNSQVPTVPEMPSSVTPSIVPEVHTFRPAN